jgi:hypothetical protein
MINNAANQKILPITNMDITASHNANNQSFSNPKAAAHVEQVTMLHANGVGSNASYGNSSIDPAYQDAVGLPSYLV